MFAWSSVCGERPAVMGIVNVTPDSFSDGGRFLDPGAAVEHGLALVGAGAAILDVGGESTRPGAEPVAEAEELRRVLPVVARLAAESGVPVSIDTSKAAVATAALEAGAVIVNDVTAATGDDRMLPAVAAAGAGVVLMHMQGDPRTMQAAPVYDDVVVEVGDFLVDRISAGPRRRRRSRRDLRRSRVRVRQDRGAQPRTARAARRGGRTGRRPGARGDVAQVVHPRRARRRRARARDDGTLATVVWAVDHGARIVRVHDAGAAADALRLLDVMAAIDAVASR